VKWKYPINQQPPAPVNGSSSGTSNSQLPFKKLPINLPKHPLKPLVTPRDESHSRSSDAESMVKPKPHSDKPANKSAAARDESAKRGSSRNRKDAETPSEK
jgi:hypothetical protein